MPAALREVRGGRFILSEKAIQNQIIEYLLRRGIPYAQVRNTGQMVSDKRTGGVRFVTSKYAQRGVADILCVYRGHGIALEVKSADGSVSEFQKEWLEKWRARGGGVAMVVRGVSEVESLFEILDARPLPLPPGANLPGA